MRFEGTLAPIIVPDDYNYIGVFLTLECGLQCSYCINRFDELVVNRRLLSGNDWVKGLNRLVSVPDRPVSLQGGEPTLHADFFAIVNGIRPELAIDILTNLEVDVERFMQEIPPGRIKRDAPYASIRVSYHPETMRIEPLAAKVQRLLAAGYSVGIWGVLHPDWEQEILSARDYCVSCGIDFRTKEFLGECNSDFFGTIHYVGACDRDLTREVLCRTTELLIGPTGDIYRCHSDLYAGRDPIGHLLDPDLRIDDRFRPCGRFGHCNPCDVKVKTNRFQVDGHASVEIMFK